LGFHDALDIDLDSTGAGQWAHMRLSAFIPLFLIFNTVCGSHHNHGYSTLSVSSSSSPIYQIVTTFIIIIRNDLNTTLQCMTNLDTNLRLRLNYSDRLKLKKNLRRIRRLA